MNRLSGVDYPTIVTMDEPVYVTDDLSDALKDSLGFWVTLQRMKKNPTCFGAFHLAHVTNGSLPIPQSVVERSKTKMADRSEEEQTLIGVRELDENKVGYWFYREHYPDLCDDLSDEFWSYVEARIEHLESIGFEYPNYEQAMHTELPRGWPPRPVS